jgi:RNA polymerase sigma-70 factor (ECF subfamily)
MIDDPSPAEFVARAQTGDEQAFTELVRTYYSKICLYLARLVSYDEQWRDLAQETFLQAWKRLPELRCAQQFTPWLYRIATNEAISFLRKEKLKQEHSQLLPDDEAYILDAYQSAPGPEESVIVEDWLKRALQALEPQCRVCLLLFVIGGFSQREIARLLGIRESTVSGNVCCGREHLRHYRSLERKRA